MCGRYKRKSDKQRIAEAFSVSGPSIEPLMVAPNDDIRPTTFQPIIRTDEDGLPTIELARWGFVPFWQKDGKFPPTTFNARAEGIEKAAMWRHSLSAKRCLVPADSFYEWKHIAKKGNPKYEFTVREGEPFAFAGLWSSWKNPADSTELHSFTIITTDPNSLMEKYHNRMPVILKPSEYERWLKDDRVPIDLLRSYDAEAMAATCVDPGTTVTSEEATLFDSL
jgi:putative SOS response-associated peptidase YedK